MPSVRPRHWRWTCFTAPPGADSLTRSAPGTSWIDTTNPFPRHWSPVTDSHC